MAVEFSALQTPLGGIMQAFGVLFVVSLNKLLIKRSSNLWYITPWYSIDVTLMNQVNIHIHLIP